MSILLLHPSSDSRAPSPYRTLIPHGSDVVLFDQLGVGRGAAAQPWDSGRVSSSRSTKMGSRNNRDPRAQAQTPDPENSVEFCVKVRQHGHVDTNAASLPSESDSAPPLADMLQPAEDLVLEGTHKSLLRVRANTPYR
jgi:hypothetical protein